MTEKTITQQLNSFGPGYEESAKKIKKCRDCVAGEEAVKAAGVEYLPALADQSPYGYEAYKTRALFYEATGRTVSGMIGGLFRKPPTENSKSPVIKKELESVGINGEDHYVFSKSVATEVATVNRVGMLVDADRDGLAYIALYKTESILSGTSTDLIRLEEITFERDEGEFEAHSVRRIRVLDLDERGIYRQRLYTENEKKELVKEGDDIYPGKKGGKRFEYIPFFFANSKDITSSYHNPEILGLANVNISHYRTYADLENGRHITGVPTPAIAGFEVGTDQSGAKRFMVGETLYAPQAMPGMMAQYMGYNSKELESLENGLTHKEQQMSALGARMLDTPSKSPESGEALSERHSGERSVMSAMSWSLSKGLSMVYSALLEMRGVNAVVEYELNSDFTGMKLDGTDLTALSNMRANNHISQDVLAYNLKRGEIYPDGIDLEEEAEKIEADRKADESFGRATFSE